MTEPGTVSEQLERSFALLRERLPRGWARVGAALGSLSVTIELGPSEPAPIVVRGGTDGPRVVHERSATATSEVHIAVTPATVLAVLDGELPLARAVVDDRLQIRGRLEHVAAVHEAIVAYVHGGVRCPGFPALLAGFRGHVRGPWRPTPRSAIAWATSDPARET